MRARAAVDPTTAVAIEAQDLIARRKSTALQFAIERGSGTPGPSALSRTIVVDVIQGQERYQRLSAAATVRASVGSEGFGFQQRTATLHVGPLLIAVRLVVSQAVRAALGLMSMVVGAGRRLAARLVSGIPFSSDCPGTVWMFLLPEINRPSSARPTPSSKVK